MAAMAAVASSRAAGGSTASITTAAEPAKPNATTAPLQPAAASEARVSRMQADVLGIFGKATRNAATDAGAPVQPVPGERGRSLASGACGGAA